MNATIALIDDDRNILTSVGIALQAEGFTTRLYTDGESALKALIELREEVRDIVDLRLIAFPQDGVLSFPNGKDLMREAMRLGCDIIGGIPHYEWTRDDGVEEVHFLFDLARETGAPIDLHCDETDDEQSLSRHGVPSGFCPTIQHLRPPAAGARAGNCMSSRRLERSRPPRLRSG